MRLKIFHVDRRLQYFKKSDANVLLKSNLTKLKIYFFDSFGTFILLSALDDASGWVLEEAIRGRS